MRISTSASIRINASQEKVWEYISNLTNVPNFLKGWGPIPGVKNVTITNNDKRLSVGLTQTTTLSSGARLFETINNVTKPSYFDYEIVGFKPPISFLTKKGGGSWTLHRKKDKTDTTWRYYFEVKNPVFMPIALPLVKLFYKKALNDAVRRVKNQIE